MFISHNAAQLYTVEFGSGPRTILAHGGWTGSWELWSEPFTSLSKTWRTVAYDHRGTGASLAPVETISLENMVADVFAVMDSMNIEKCVLAAESAGGMVAVQAVLQQPQRFDGLVLVSSLLYNEKNGAEAAFIQGLKTNYEETIGRFVDACVLETEEDSREIRSWGRKILLRASPESAIRLLECTHGVDLRPNLPRVRIPTLILHGEQDAIVPLSDSEYIASQIPGSRLHIIKGAGHAPTTTCPGEVAGQINYFFGKNEV